MKKLSMILTGCGVVFSTAAFSAVAVLSSSIPVSANTTISDIQAYVVAKDGTQLAQLALVNMKGPQAFNVPKGVEYGVYFTYVVDSTGNLGHVTVHNNIPCGGRTNTEFVYNGVALDGYTSNATFDLENQISGSLAPTAPGFCNAVPIK